MSVHRMGAMLKYPSGEEGGGGGGGGGLLSPSVRWVHFLVFIYTQFLSACSDFST